MSESRRESAPRGSVSRGGSASRGDLHPGEGVSSREVGQTPPPSDTTGYNQQAGGTHPTGMYSCFFLEISDFDTNPTVSRTGSIKQRLCYFDFIFFMKYTH